MAIHHESLQPIVLSICQPCVFQTVFHIGIYMHHISYTIRYFGRPNVRGAIGFHEQILSTQSYSRNISHIL